MKKKNKKIIIRRLPAELVQVLRSKGGVHKSKKGKGSYDRNLEKRVKND